MLLSNCAVSGSKKSKFIKEQIFSILLISLGIKIPFSKIPLVGPSLILKVYNEQNNTQVFISKR